MDLNSRLLNVETEMKGEMREEIQSLNFKLRNETNFLIKRIDDLETYIHGPTRKPFDE